MLANCVRSKAPQTIVVMSEGDVNVIGARARAKSRKAMETEENLKTCQPKTKKVKKSKEQGDKACNSEPVLYESDADEEEEEAEEEDEEDEEVMTPQKVTFVMGAVQGKPPMKNEFFWESKTSTTLGKAQLSLPITLRDLVEALRPIFNQKCFKELIEDNYRLGIVLPLLGTPAGRKKPINQVQLVDETLRLDENSGGSIKIVVIARSAEVNPPAVAEEEGGEEAEAGAHHPSDFTITVLVGAVRYDENYLASEPTDSKKHSTKSSVTVRLGESNAPMHGVTPPLTLAKIKTYVEKLWSDVNDEIVDLNDYEIRLLSSTDKAKTGEATSAPWLFTCNRLIDERFERRHTGHITVVLVHPGIPDAKVAKFHGSAVDSERVKTVAVCKLANETSKNHVTTGSFPKFLDLFKFEVSIGREAQQTCMRELYMAASKLVHEKLDWLRHEDVKRGRLLIETLLHDKDKVNDLKLPDGCALVTTAGGDNHAGSNQTVSGTPAVDISKMELTVKTSVPPGAPSSSSWVDVLETITVEDLAKKLSQLPHNRLLSVQTAVICGKDLRIPAETFLPLEKIVATKGYDDSYFVVRDGDLRTSLRIKCFKAQDPPLDEDADPELED